MQSSKNLIWSGEFTSKLKAAEATNSNFTGIFIARRLINTAQILRCCVVLQFSTSLRSLPCFQS